MTNLSEPARLFSLINAAIAATVGVFVLTGAIDEKLAGGLILALGGWVAVAGEMIRMKVTPVDSPSLTPRQLASVKLNGQTMTMTQKDTIIEHIDSLGNAA